MPSTVDYSSASIPTSKVRVQGEVSKLTHHPSNKQEVDSRPHSKAPYD